jgi:hypothetical protein
MWVLLWVLLVLLAAVVLGALSWGLVRRALALGRELGRTAERVGPVLEQIQEPYRPASSVLSDPTIAPQARPDRAGHRRSSSGHRRFPAGRAQQGSGRVG